MPRKTERAVVALVTELLGAQLGATPRWLMRPGKEECGSRWPLVRSVYNELESLDLPETMPPRERRQVDAVLVVDDARPRILEVDESQHFNLFRTKTLRRYTADFKLAFPAQTWIEKGEAKKRLEGGGWSRPCPPLFPGKDGRHRQRAFRDALADILPAEHGWAPTLRIGEFEVRSWISAPEAADKLRSLLLGRGVSVAGASSQVSTAAASEQANGPLPARSNPPRRETHSVNRFLQDRLRARNLDEVGAVEAAAWLDHAAVLRDSQHRPGLPLRNLLRAGEIVGAEQRPPQRHGRWFIRRVPQPPDS